MPQLELKLLFKACGNVKNIKMFLFNSIGEEDFTFEHISIIGRKPDGAPTRNSEAGEFGIIRK